ncbi:MAG: hypothetical protein OEU26_25500 [Candidatus Tectomicrobia bacterium]|nr:hypothetical protein [Candidatus Tectomicrobia bacterium]
MKRWNKRPTSSLQTFWLVTVAMLSVMGYDNTMCNGTARPRVYAYEDTNRNGIVDVIDSDAIPDAATHWQVPDVNHKPPWRIFIANRYAQGANVVVFAFFETCVGFPQFVALHLNRSGATLQPLYYAAGNVSETTGPQNEHIGSVMLGADAAGPLSYDPSTRRITGRFGGPVGFTVTLPNTNPPVSFQSAAHVTFDLSQGVALFAE